MRKLATIRKVSAINPIKGKDRVEMATVDGWTCMVSKADNFKEGSLCIFCEPDSVFPVKEEWEFLKKYNYRIKTQKFKDSDGNAIYSQGLVLPLSVLPASLKVVLGIDVTDILGITQYEPTMDKETNTTPVKGFRKFLEKLPFMRFSWYRNLVKPKKGISFPSFLSKTDEERIQNCSNMVTQGSKWLMTEKVDGQSGTFAMIRHRHFLFDTFEFIVCSRNMRKPYKDNSSYWFVAEKYNIEKCLKDYLKKNRNLDWVAIQGECVAPNVQGNKYHVKEPDLYVFNFIDSNHGRHIYSEMLSFTDTYNMKTVPYIGSVTFEELPENPIELVNNILKMANGKSQLCDTLREGIVFRNPYNYYISFKAVSPEFLIKNGE